MSAKQFPDHFSRHASDYARYHPWYPAKLYDYLASLTPDHDRAWDAGTGNGPGGDRVGASFPNGRGDRSERAAEQASDAVMESYYRDALGEFWPPAPQPIPPSCQPTVKIRRAIVCQLIGKINGFRLS